MKKSIFFLLLALLPFVAVSQDPGQNLSQNKYPEITGINEITALNPNANRDATILATYVAALTKYHDYDKAAQLLSPDAWSYSSLGDSLNAKDVIKTWKQWNKNREDPSIHFVTASFKVMKGNLKGTWVYQWGTYSYIDKASDNKINVPYHLAAKVENGKVGDNMLYYDDAHILNAMGFKFVPPDSSNLSRR